mmetsp:Transcript_30621/g.78163  ORF Transcript_30621/g.78163 Transcript_30621/m.78163 type:complete len:238 (-) Transcript_30621:330-1043(-)
MDSIKNLFGGAKTAASSSQAEQQSLLGDWNSYNQAKDVEAGPSTSDTLFQNVEKAGTSVSGFFKDSLTNISKGASTAVAALPSTETLSIPSTQQLAYFFAFLAGGGVMLALAFLFFLPVIILSPSKFALSFTLGCVLIMAGFAQLRGWKQQLGHMMTRERLPFSVAYLGSIGATLYAALIMHSYLLSLLCSGLQVVTLLYYLMSYFPGGTSGVRFVLGLFGQAAMSCFASLQALLLK